MGLRWKADIALTKIKGARIATGKDGKRWLCIDDPAVFYIDKNNDVKLDLVAFDKKGQYSDGFVKRSRRKDEPQTQDDPILGNYKEAGQASPQQPKASPGYEPGFE